ncbi:endospore germination permease [Paenibacillus chitinolyticus]|uniref:GerAB/ArcD/ProY family transporter n=1 Tax=Paenibacillus chitinolyticus TaxID=79263 RepID=UPI00386C8350
MNDRRFTNWQAMCILISTIAGVGVLPLPRLAVAAGETAAPLVTVAGILLGALLVMLWSLLGMRFPGLSPVAYSKLILGKWASGVLLVVIALFYLVATAFSFREFSEVTGSFVLRRTPLEVILFMMLLLVLVSARKDIYSFTLIHAFYTPFVVGPAVFIMLLSFSEVDQLNLQPFTTNPDLTFWIGSLGITTLFRNVVIYSFIVPRMKNPQKALKVGLIGTAISGGLYLVIVITTVGVFGAEEIKRLVWPTLELGRATIVPGEFLERMDAIFLIVWIISVFNSLLSGYYLILLIIKEELGLKDHRMLATFLMPFMFLAAMMPQNVIQLYRLSTRLLPWGLIAMILIPSVLLLIAGIRGKGGVTHAPDKG